MKKIKLVGIGPGNINYISSLAVKSIQAADIVIGSKRQINDIEELIADKKNIQRYLLTKLNIMIDFIKENREKNICVLVSGDTGFYSVIPYMKKFFDRLELEIIPAISSYQYLFAKIGENWQNYLLASVHGRNYDYVNNLKNENIEGLVLLTDDVNNPYEIAKNLWEDGQRDIEIIVGENLSYENEKISIEKIEDFENLNRAFEMNIVIIKKGENYAHL